MKHIIRLLLVVLLFSFSSGAYSKEVSKVGTTAAKFLSIPVGARALGMGGAFAAVANDITAIYWNPGGLAEIKQNQLFFLHSNWLANINFDYLAVAMPVRGVGTVGVSLTALTMGDMEITTEDQPDGTGETFNAASYAFGLTFSRRLTDAFMIGGNVKYILERIWHSTATGLAIDIGTLFYTPFYGIRFGTSISNFGTKMQMAGNDLLVQKDIDPQRSGNNESVNAYLATDKFDMPLNLKIGLSRDFNLGASQRLTLAVDALYPNDNKESLNLGFEYAALNEKVFLRGGYKSLFLQDSEEEFTLGAGLHQKLLGNMQIYLDYAFQSFVRLESVHKFSILLTF